MNRIAAIALIATATLMTGGNARAQSSAIEVNVPFNFTVNNTSLQPGNYTFGFDSMYRDMLVVRDPTKSVKARGFGERGSIGPSQPGTLIFQRYGDQYFLSEICFDSASNGIFLPETRLEKQARMVSRKEELAFVEAY